MKGDTDDMAEAIPYLSAIQTASANPEQLERLYQSAREAHETASFTRAMLLSADSEPVNLLYSAWYYRLQQPAEGVPSTTLRPN
jgi:hypothetical protein